ncbi:TrmH family RNA methyltransferase [Algoriphagus boritolerans]|uniref:tRNA (guanosine(18)-2'-O)-methyltransferase n=1 Tax=Algoriphagus boritolerans DSM 17298 = JCM 18970 TaxID=1120964 RepID=A0A1H5XNH9_9BACT|nr:RNA methyltransferase [Algoriphagus boritolerans]SEG13331.1 tRNA (guanosine-2'-O-)-methyltransferase [Algoriphagus boritolerans DSM 17298 = JCM 18970]
MVESIHNNEFDQDLLNYLGQFITDHKKSVIEMVLAKRSRHLTVVLEDIFKPHNASAVIRTCDCFGLQDIHIIEKTNQYKVNPFVTRGTSQWIDLHKYYREGTNSVDNCFSWLRENGYRIYGTSPSPSSISIHELQPTEKLALVFCNEHEGISEEVKSKADGLVQIPMLGFTESFNISVSASIFLYDLVKKAEKLNLPDFYLSESEKNTLRMKWYRSLVKNSAIHEKVYLKNISKNQ